MLHMFFKAVNALVVICEVVLLKPIILARANRSANASRFIGI